MKELNLTQLLNDNDLIHRKLSKAREVIRIYKAALKTYSRKFPTKENMNAAEDALERGLKLEKFI